MKCQAVSHEKWCALSATSLWDFFRFGVDISESGSQSIVSSKHTARMNLVLSLCHPGWLLCPRGISGRVPSTSVHCHIPHIVPRICLFSLQSYAAKNVWHQITEKYQARQSCRCETPQTCHSGSGQPWGNLLQWARKTEKKSSIAEIPWPSSAQNTQAQQEPRVSLQGQYYVSTMKDLASPEITSSSGFVSCWAELIYMGEPK